MLLCFPGICVAGYTAGAKSEILELLLPLKLYAGDNQVNKEESIARWTEIGFKCLLIIILKGLCAERDFKVQHGGFSEEPIECLIHIPGTR